LRPLPPLPLPPAINILDNGILYDTINGKSAVGNDDNDEHIFNSFTRSRYRLFD
jgi:hypothetical protein